MKLKTVLLTYLAVATATALVIPRNSAKGNNNDVASIQNNSNNQNNNNNDTNKNSNGNNNNNDNKDKNKDDKSVKAQNSQDDKNNNNNNNNNNDDKDKNNQNSQNNNDKDAKDDKNNQSNGKDDKASNSPTNFGSCDPSIDFQLGRKGRKPDEGTFLPVDPLILNGQQDALNPDIIINRVCDKLSSDCKASKAAVENCQDAREMIKNLKTKDDTTAEAFNNAIGAPKKK